MQGAAQILLPCGRVAVIDRSDEPRTSHLSWSVTPKGYVVAWLPGVRPRRRISLHRLLLCFPLFDIDHRNGDRLDNRRFNLRPANNSQNACNSKKRIDASSSKYKGVHWSHSRQKWVAKVAVAGRVHYAGYHRTPLSAAIAYDAKAVDLHREFARVNFPEKFGLLLVGG